MSAGSEFCLRWEEGATAQLELFSPDTDDAAGSYQLKYTPPFRSTLRPPVEQRPLGPGELAPIDQALTDFVQAGVNGAGSASPARGGTRPDAEIADPMAPMIMIGQQLFALIVPRHVQVDLRAGGLFLEIGIDEELLNYPWELMHDGEDFLCEKHFVSRFVNVVRRPIPPREQRDPSSGLKELSVLLISVPRPQPRDGIEYEDLPEAEAETEAIIEVLQQKKGVKLQTIVGKHATFDAVFSALKQNEYHVIHYNGHARFRDDNPALSGLVLFNRDMTTGPLVSFFGQRPPILSFMNACETGLNPGWKENYNIYSLARSLLETGSYLIGSRWKLSDTAAKVFASTFYAALVDNGFALGPAIKNARAACRAASNDNDVGWASYVFYGDPRICFRPGP